MAKEDFHFFWTTKLSQWTHSKFVIDGVEYNCCEQYMMAKKALMFGDLKHYELIMGTDKPDQQKMYGRDVIGFNKKHWEEYCCKIVYDGNYAKFSQNPDMLTELLATGTKEIVEASPEDRIWGIGLRKTNPLAWDKSTWAGTNWLGKAIEQVRETIIEETIKWKKA